MRFIALLKWLPSEWGRSKFGNIWKNGLNQWFHPPFHATRNHFSNFSSQNGVLCRARWTLLSFFLHSRFSFFFFCLLHTELSAKLIAWYYSKSHIPHHIVFFLMLETFLDSDYLFNCIFWFHRIFPIKIEYFLKKNSSNEAILNIILPSFVILSSLNGHRSFLI